MNDSSNVIDFAPRSRRATRKDREAWHAGIMVPYRITSALDLAGQEGPEVDVALGGAEPMVDLWEAGELYPSWSQLLKLSALTGFPVAYFFSPVDVREWYETQRSMFICGPDTRDPRPPMPRHLPVTEFTAAAIIQRKP